MFQESRRGVFQPTQEEEGKERAAEEGGSSGQRYNGVDERDGEGDSGIYKDPPNSGRGPPKPQDSG